MPREIIATPDAPSSPLYSQAVRAGNHVYISGTVGIDVKTGALAGDTIQVQTRQALANCEAILNAGGSGMDDLVEIGVLLARAEDFVGFNEEYARWFASDPPARYVAKLGVDLPGILISIRAIAVTA
ncbi:MAG: RidA family protein [Microbacterium sp.]|uniref:RidA family protein n=1 Tax=Microbacterium sp. TaxID=51671 RepID=UPI001D5DD8FE|nr:Rid family hydrolase [Microbacterium sp.]MBW8764039.1 RidA family protein [Microbacterium sp.]